MAALGATLPAWSAAPKPAQRPDKALYDTGDTNIIKKSRQNICHDQTSGNFESTLHFKACRTMQDCIDSGRRRAC